MAIGRMQFLFHPTTIILSFPEKREKKIFFFFRIGREMKIIASLLFNTHKRIIMCLSNSGRIKKCRLVWKLIASFIQEPCEPINFVSQQMKSHCFDWSNLFCETQCYNIKSFQTAADTVLAVKSYESCP